MNAVMRTLHVSTSTATATQPAFAQAIGIATIHRPRRASTWQATATSRPPSSTPPAVKPAKNAARTFRLAPSDFAFLWEECKRCFYLKAHGNMYRPRAPFPSVFSTIDTAMKHHFRGLRTTDLLPDMPPGVFLCEDDDAWVESMPITPPNHTNSVFIRGMIDCLVRFEDNTYGIVDFKTSSVAKSSKLYARQLHAYATALQNPSPGCELQQCTISDLGLVVYSPADFHTPTSDNRHVAAALTGQLTYAHIPYDYAAFETFLSQVLDVLALPEAPPPPRPTNTRSRSRSRSQPFSSCPYCTYLHDAQMHGLIPERL